MCFKFNARCEIYFSDGNVTPKRHIKIVLGEGFLETMAIPHQLFPKHSLLRLLIKNNS